MGFFPRGDTLQTDRAGEASRANVVKGVSVKGGRRKGIARG